MITVVLTKYKRLEYFEEQVQSIKNQSISIDEILVCDNSVNNKGVWERFKTAQKARNEFVCIFDDDTIPGTLFLENCFTEFWKKEGLYGTRGQIFHSKTNPYDGADEYGWTGHNKITTEVDYVTHSWFFKKQWLEYFWNIDDYPFDYGEDMNFSFQLQKQGIKTYCPPHPFGNMSLWGSLRGQEYGNDGNGLYTWGKDNSKFIEKMNTHFQKQLNEGWKLIMDRKVI